MNCPFCGEDIRDDALVCKHCNRDWVIFVPIQKNLKDLTEKIALLDKTVKNLQERADATQVAPAQAAPELDRAGDVSYSVLSLLTVLITAGTFCAWYVSAKQLDMPFISPFAIAAVCLVAGVIAWRWTSALDPVQHVFYALTIALLSTATLVVGRHSIENTTQLIPEGTALILIGEAMAFLTGAYARKRAGANSTATLPPTTLLLNPEIGKELAKALPGALVSGILVILGFKG